MTNACTHLGAGQIGCHVVQVTDQGLRVEIQRNNNSCAGQYVSQFGGEIFDGLVKVVSTAAQLVRK